MSGPVRFVSAEILKEIHRRAIDSGSRDESSLRDAVRDEGTLHFIAEKADSISDPVKRAAFLLHGIATMHPFYEGNKRTALLSADDALGQSGYCIKDSPDDLNKFIRKTASGEIEECEVVSWIRSVSELIR